MNMKKTFLILLFFNCYLTLLFAQDRDSVLVEQNITEKTTTFLDSTGNKSTIVDDSIFSQNLVISDTLKDINNELPPLDSVKNVINTEENNKNPKIYYFKDTSTNTPSKKSWDKYTYKFNKKQSDIKTLTGSINHNGGFGSLTFKATTFKNESLVMAGLRGGWIINKTLAIGLEAYGLIPTTQFNDIDPEKELSLLGGYGGMFLELIFFSNEVIHITFPVLGGMGGLGYYEVYNDNDTPPNNNEYDTDEFWLIEPGVNAELNVSKNFRLNFGISKRFVQNFDILNTSSNEFTNLNYSIGLKIGCF